MKMSINFNIKEFEKHVTRAERWALLDKKELRKIHRKVSKTYVSALKGKIKNADKTITIKRKGSKTVITPGTLRRSIGTWNSGPSSNVVLSGPRARFLGRSVSDRSDGWFAHIVEQGALPKAFGGKRTGKYTGVFESTLKATEGRMKTQLAEELAARLQKFMK
jgi:hypothetical protein